MLAFSEVSARNWLNSTVTSVHSLSELQLAGIKPDYSQEGDDDTVDITPK